MRSAARPQHRTDGPATPGTPGDAQADLVRRLVDSDPEVLNDILQAYGGVVMGKLRQAFAPAFRGPDLEEIVVDALYRVWENRASYDSERGSLLTWFLRIARNVAIDHGKRGWRRAQARECALALDDLHLPDRAEEAEGQPPSAAHQDLLEILDALDGRDRSIILAYARSYGEGSWTGPLVEELGMNAGAIRTRAHRIFYHIRREMQQRGRNADDLPERVS